MALGEKEEKLLPSQLYFKRAVMHICRLMEACVLKWVVGGLSGAEVGQVYLERNPDIHKILFFMIKWHAENWRSEIFNKLDYLLQYLGAISKMTE